MNPPIIARFMLDYGAFQLDVDLNLPSRGISVLFGDSGSGKTSLLRCIAGLQKASYGFLQVNGQIWQDSSTGIFLPTHKRPLGYVFQEANLFSHLTVKENICFGLKRIKSNLNRSKLEHSLELLNIAHLMQRMPMHLSGGEKQRVAIARALALDPEILLMDEPLASLDFKIKQEIMPFLSGLHQQLNIPVIYVTHAQQEVMQLADNLVILAKGKVLASGMISEISSSLRDFHEHESTVWRGSVIEHEPDYHLTQIACGEVLLCLPKINAPVGKDLRVQIYAQDVAISLEMPTASSILNILPATVCDIGEDHHGQAMVRLKTYDQTFSAHISQKSVLLLNLQAGMKVYVQIKSASILN